MIIGIDIGGANTKAASSDGKFTFSRYLPLWKGADLAGTLNDIKRCAGRIDAVGVTITGELADCFSSKKEGIIYISNIVKSVFKDAVFFGSDGNFYGDACDHKLFSASNWSASALCVGLVHKNVIFIDIGSTTTDLIPIMDGIPIAGNSDMQRLAKNELIYSGALRTNLAALMSHVHINGMNVRTSSELFAITGDVYVLLDSISPEDYTCDAPDCGEKNKNGAMLRVARVICCDLEEITVDDVLDIASQVHNKQVSILKEAIEDLSQRHGLNKAVICGLGAFLAKDALQELCMPFTAIGQVYGDEISRVFPAYAVAKLLESKRSEGNLI
jgi:hypothetical protein